MESNNQNSSVKLSPSAMNKITKDRSKKRKSNPSEWKDVKRKTLRDGGNAYTSKRGKSVEERKKPTDDFHCSCKNPGCKRITSEQKLLYFLDFYKLSYNEQTLYLMKFIDIKEPGRRRKGNSDATSRKLATFSYKLGSVKVCKSTIIHTFSISSRRIQTIQTNMKQGISVPKDKRGMHFNRPHSINNDLKNLVRSHINSFPRQPSHYSRHKTEREFLSPDLSVSKMYREFNDKHPEVEVSRIYYQSIFYEMNLRIGAPRSDTCKYCDLLYNKLCAAETEGEREKILLDSKLHHFKADQAYKSMHNDGEIAKENNNVTVLCVDLQQVLFCPTLTHSSMYYQRQLSTYNFAVHNLGDNTVTFYVWSEITGKRGSTEIASCLLKHITEHFQPYRCRKLIVWSDRCVGQNNNWLNLALYKQFVKSGYFEEVHQKFLCSGHSFLPCDRHFALIEKQKRVSTVNVPTEWRYVIGESFVSRNFKIIEMNRDDFKNFEPIKQGIVKPSNLKITEVMWLKFSQDEPRGIYVRKSHNILRPFDYFPVVTSRLITSESISILNLVPMYSDDLPITKEKKKDLLDMLQYMKAEYHSFYLNLKTE